MDSSEWEARRLMQGRARELRREMTLAERRLWGALRGGGVLGLRFRRQVVLGVYVADFACLPVKVVVEVDGPTHAGRADYDAERTSWLVSQGYVVLRYRNDQVLDELEAMVADLRRVCEGRMG
jgi:very-short-patch-repair endonuclease